jgi:hypothetical protein
MQIRTAQTIYTKKLEADADAKTLRSLGHTVGMTQVLIKRRALPYGNVYGWKLIIDGEIAS